MVARRDLDRADPVIDALERSAARLDADLLARPTPAFRSHGRAVLLRSGEPSSGGRPVSLSRRLAVAGVAVLAFGLVSMPALAGPGGFGSTFSTVAAGVRLAISGEKGAELTADTAASSTDQIELLQEETPTPEPTGTPEPAETPESAVPESTNGRPSTHGQSVSQVARDNHGAQVSAVATSNASGSEADHGQQVSEVAQENHGAEVSAVATSNEPGDEANHGQQVSAVARDNHGAQVSEVATSKGDEHQEGEQEEQPVRDVARDNHGAQVSETAKSGKPAGPPSGGEDEDGQDETSGE